MQWSDEGIILGVKRHGETSVIADVLTRDHGRYLGLVRGGRSRVQRPVLQAGNSVAAVWRARIEDHLGGFVLEPVKLRAASIMDDPFRLAGLMTLTALAQLLPEREAHRRLHEASLLVLDQLEADRVWPALLVRWEMGLLEELGFGLDIAQCAATGVREGLAYVSPKTGRAVSLEAGEPWKDRLLVLPAFLGAEGGSPDRADIQAGFKLTGYFLERHVMVPRGVAMPEARDRVLGNL
jgi:DNA repair protein RecO (recombination protein O)